MKLRTFRFTTISVILVLIIPILLANSSTKVEFAERFDNSSLEGWEFQNYNGTAGYRDQPIPHHFEVKNGTLIAPDTARFKEYNRAMHPSTQVTGQWTLDWKVPDDYQVFDALEIMFRDMKYNNNWSNLPENQIRAEIYAFLIEVQSSTSITITFVKFLNPQSDVGSYKSVLASSTFNSANVGGWHNIIVTRDEAGLTKFSIDNNQVLSITDNDYSETDYFSWISFEGDSAIDNITLSREQQASSTANVSLPVTPIVLILVLLSTTHIARTVKK